VLVSISTLCPDTVTLILGRLEQIDLEKLIGPDVEEPKGVPDQEYAVERAEQLEAARLDAEQREQQQMEKQFEWASKYFFLFISYDLLFFFNHMIYMTYHVFKNHMIYMCLFKNQMTHVSVVMSFNSG